MRDDPPADFAARVAWATRRGGGPTRVSWRRPPHSTRVGDLHRPAPDDAHAPAICFERRVHSHLNLIELHAVLL